MIKITIIAMAVIAALFMPSIPHAQSSVPLDGQVLHFDNPEEIEIGCKLVPMRVIFEAFGANVSWDESTSTITATVPGTAIKLSLKGTFLINGRTFVMDVPPQLVNGRTMVPLKFITESLGHQVTWYGTMQEASITDKARQLKVKVRFLELGQSTALCIDTVKNYEVFYYTSSESRKTL